MKVYPRESVEFHEIPILLDGDPETPELVAVSAWYARPTTWAAPTTIDSKHGVMVTGLDPGYYRTWAKIVDNPESPVVESEPFTVT